MSMSSVVDCLRVAEVVPDGRPPVFLVPSTEAIPLCEREGFSKLAPAQAISLVDRLARTRRSEVRALLSRLRLASLPLDRLADAQLFSVVRTGIRTGSLVGVRPGRGADARAGKEAAERRRLVRKIEQQVRGRLDFAGRRYRLVTDVGLAKLAERDHYEVVRHDDAVQVLTALAGHHAGGDMPELLRQASRQLTRDWRPPISNPDGLVLLRHVPVLAADGKPQSAITPSQVAKLLAAEEAVNLEVEVRGFDDKPLAGIAFVIAAPDAETHEGDLGAGGKTTIKSAKQGAAGVWLKWSEASTGN